MTVSVHGDIVTVEYVVVVSVVNVAAVELKPNGTLKARIAPSTRISINRIARISFAHLGVGYYGGQRKRASEPALQYQRELSGNT